MFGFKKLADGFYKLAPNRFHVQMEGHGASSLLNAIVAATVRGTGWKWDKSTAGAEPTWQSTGAFTCQRSWQPVSLEDPELGERPRSIALKRQLIFGVNVMRKEDSWKIEYFPGNNKN
jgi:hypothetical protein